MYQWWIPDGYVPATPDDSTIVGHEAIAILNDTNTDATLFVDVFYTDHEPDLGISFTIPAQRSARIILGEAYTLTGSLRLHVAPQTPYSLRLRSTSQLHIQFTRVDTRAYALSVMTAAIYEGR